MSKSYRRRNTIGGQFAPRLIEMLRSPAYRALSRAAHQVLARDRDRARGPRRHGQRQAARNPCTTCGIRPPRPCDRTRNS